MLLKYNNLLNCYFLRRMLQNSFVDMENMMDLLNEKIEVRNIYDDCYTSFN